MIGPGTLGPRQRHVDALGDNLEPRGSDAATVERYPAGDHRRGHRHSHYVLVEWRDRQGIGAPVPADVAVLHERRDAVGLEIGVQGIGERWHDGAVEGVQQRPRSEIGDGGEIDIPKLRVEESFLSSGSVGEPLHVTVDVSDHRRQAMRRHDAPDQCRTVVVDSRRASRQHGAHVRRASRRLGYLGLGGRHADGRLDRHRRCHRRHHGRPGAADDAAPGL